MSLCLAVFNLNTVRKSASRMANYLESKNPSFSKLFNVKAIDESERWSIRKPNGSTASQTNGDDRLKAVRFITKVLLKFLA